METRINLLRVQYVKDLVLCHYALMFYHRGD